MKPVYFNGKFYSGGLNGVHRVADRLVREYDTVLQSMPPSQRPSTFLLLPEGSKWAPDLELIEQVPVQRAGQAWEQFELPRLSADGVLVNLANLSPIAHRRKITMMHDVQFLRPDCGYPFRQRMGYRWLAPWMARTSAAVVTVSEFSRSMLDQFGVSPARRTRVIPNGVDHILECEPDVRLRHDLGLQTHRYVVLIGSTKRYKNVEVVFKAFQTDPPAGVALVVVGCARSALLEAGLEPPQDAIFTGKVDDASLRDLMENALAIAFPSRTEGFGLPPLEAMLCGCPVIASPGGAIPESCGSAAIYAGADDPAAWRNAIRALAGDERLRTAKTAEGRERAGRFTWSDAGRRLAAIVEEVANS